MKKSFMFLIVFFTFLFTYGSANALEEEAFTQSFRVSDAESGISLMSKKRTFLFMDGIGYKMTTRVLYLGILDEKAVISVGNGENVKFFLVGLNQKAFTTIPMTDIEKTGRSILGRVSIHFTNLDTDSNIAEFAISVFGSVL